jgi:hypothetical protein
MRVPETWVKYDGILTWGKDQTLAILDDGCDVHLPEWQCHLPWGNKVIATWNSIEGNENCAHGPTGYHGTSVGFPSSINYGQILGVAYNNFVAHVRCVPSLRVHPNEAAGTIAQALRWVLDNHERYNITSVNLSPVDVQAHACPVPTAIDVDLERLRNAGIWVSAPCSNNGFTTGISWPACQPGCFGIGAVIPGQDVPHLDRFNNTAILVPATATSSSNAYIAAASMILREAIAKAGFVWQDRAVTLPEAIMAIMQQTGIEVFDPSTGIAFRRLDVLAAVDHVFAAKQ